MTYKHDSNQSSLTRLNTNISPSYPEHQLFEMLLLAGVIPEPLEDHLAEVGEVDEALAGDVVGDVNHLLLTGIEAEAPHCLRQCCHK